MRCSEQELIQWNEILCELSYALHAMREVYVTALKKIFADYQAILPAIQNVKLDYFPGWHSESGDLSTQLSTVLKQERQQGHCLIGPHRAELVLKTSFGYSKDQLSRGRQKILAIALYLAQGELLFREKNQHPLYLIDDFSSELDSEGQKLLLDALNLDDKQVIITTLDTENTLLAEVCRKNSDVARYTINAGKVLATYPG
jgi:DNA replication and repair protein RecF